MTDSAVDVNSTGELVVDSDFSFGVFVKVGDGIYEFGVNVVVVQGTSYHPSFYGVESFDSVTVEDMEFFV